MSQGYETIDESIKKHRKLSACDVGYNAPRECTDTACIGVFGVVWALMIVVAASAVAHGDLDRLVDGVDYLGNVCGRGSPSGVTDSVKASWSSRGVLFFPVAFDPVRLFFNGDQAAKFGMCLPQCPAEGDHTVSALFYGPLAGSLTGYTPIFASSSKFNRCVPNFGSINCNGNATCERAVAASGSRFNSALGLQSTAMRSFAEVRAHWWVLLVCTFIAIAVSFAWMFVLRLIVKPVVVVTLIAVLLALVALGYVFFYRHQEAQKDAPNSSSDQWYLAAAVCTWLVAFLYICVVLFIYKDVLVACDIIEEASKVPLQMPSMLVVPPLTVVIILPTAIFALFMAAEIYTSAYLSSTVNTLQTDISSGNSTVTSNVKAYVGEDWRVYAQIFNVFVFLWTVGFVHAIGFMVISFGAVFWYWSARGDDKDTEHGILDGAALTFRNHMGSLAFGSLIIAVIQTIRVVIIAFERHMRGYVEKSDTVKFIFCCYNCCLAYFDRFVQFVNKNAYVVQCMTGESFLPAARHAMQLLVRNALSVGAVNIVGEFVMLLGKVLITAISVLIGYAILQHVNANEDAAVSSSGIVVMLIAIAIVAYFVSAVFVNVVGVCIDSVLLSYCYDLEQNNGRDKPYFFPESLGRHVERAERRARETEVRRQVELQ